MRSPTSRLRHRLQLGAAIAAAVGSVWIVSRVVSHATHRAPPPVTIKAPPPPPLEVVEPVLTPPIAPVSPIPHLTPAFRAALSEGELEAIKKAYSKEESLDLALPIAAGSGRRDVVRWLIEQGADVHVNEAEMTSPLLEADAYPEVTKLLLERGAAEADIYNAVTRGAVNAVGRILAKNKAVARPSDGTSLVTEAIGSSMAIGRDENRASIVEKLLAAGADPNEGDPLTAAIARGDETSLPIARLLLAKHANVTGDALGAAIDLDDAPARTKLIEALLGGKLAPEATATALAHATGERDAGLIKRLSSRGVAWTYHDGEGDAVAPLVDAVEKLDIALVRAMIDAGAPVDHHYKDGRSALGVALEAGPSPEAERIVELLVGRGANVNRRLPDGRSPLFAAAESGDVRMVKAILNAGARVNDRVLDETPLDAAERSGNTAVARILDARGGRRAPARIDG